ncbi:aminotransferase class I/II-fold pyridoxal phosphate-dependent enzyme [Yunchengibacter salinarum]|uniref:aminotransferase class I/II-fold pyridoxal phosphate-dependent enzyme n=1 Tax=Yunchengibacter salinarum TaxID=3133399 RepID=UPI0035B625EA
MTDAFLPYGRHSLDAGDVAAVVEVLENGPLTSGPMADRFEAAFADVVGAREAVVVANGTAALHLAAIAAGIGPGDQVIVPAITFLSSASAMLMAGAEVVFADVDPDSGLMTADTLRAALDRAPQAKAVVGVHLNGHLLDMAALSPILDQAELVMITDCCHALGARHGDGAAPGSGRHERLGTFSLHPVKAIAMGEGGVITCRDGETAARLRRLRSHAMERNAANWTNKALAFDRESGDPNPWYYEMAELGFNYRASDLHCALGLSQLAKLDRFIAARAHIAARYDDLIGRHLPPHLVRPVARGSETSGGWHLYPVQVDFQAAGTSRARVMARLKADGIGTQVHYIPLHRQPFFAERHDGTALPGADGYYAAALSLPIYPDLPEDGPDRVVAALSRALGLA